MGIGLEFLTTTKNFDVVEPRIFNNDICGKGGRCHMSAHRKSKCNSYIQKGHVCQEEVKICHHCHRHDHIWA